MQSSIKIFIIQLFFVLLIVGCADQDSQETKSQNISQDTSKTELVVEKLELPPRFLDILRQEMNQINGGMGALLSYMVRGQGEEAAGIAMNIHNSFILKQELTEEELNQLVSLLSKKFITLDRGFHQLADEIATALTNKEFKKGGQIYGQMVGACMNCHTQFATERFPGLKR